MTIKRTRREAATLLFGAALGACSSVETAPAPAASSAEAVPISLNAISAERGIRWGTAIGARVLADPGYMEMVARDCGVLVAENSHKWPQLHPAPGRWDFEPAEHLMRWAEARAIPFRGHTLVWHHPRWLPRYVMEYDFGANPRAEAERMLTEHIGTVCRHFGERIHSWDVVNEFVHNVSGEWRETPFTRIMGIESNDFMFRIAREAAPHAQLVYNDYMTWEAYSANHRAGVLRLLEQFRAWGTPVDALGIQSHIGAELTSDNPRFGIKQEAEWRRFLDEVVAMDYDLLITEFDVNDNGLPAHYAVRDRAVADYARAYLDVTLSYPQLHDVLAWGVADHYSWLQGRWPRADGTPLRATPYDADLRPKPLHGAIADALRAAPMRTPRRPLRGGEGRLPHIGATAQSVRG